MKHVYSLVWRLLMAGLLVAASSVTALSQTLQIRRDTLNDAPRLLSLPEPVHVPTSKAAINPWDRLAVVADYNQNYLGSGVTDTQLNWTGSIASCMPGTISSLAQTRTIQRINYYRRLVGLSDNMAFESTHNTETQAAALIMLANSNLSHFPPSTWTCYSTEGYTGAGNSNIALGSHSSGAVSQFINDYGSNNLAAGHRRWLLYSRAASFGHGSAQSASAPLRASDAIWVTNPTVTPASLPQFIALPPAGYVPRNIIPYRWSFGIPGADFASATVTMTNAAGTSLSVSQYTTATGYGDNTLVWDLANPTTDLAWSGSADKPFAVTISGVKLNGVVQQPYNYTVVAIDPTAVCPGATPAASCSVAVSGGQSPYFGTEVIDFNTIQLTSSNAQSDGSNYTNLSCAMQTTVTAGSTYSLTVKGYYINSHALRAWIDYNNNGVFTDPGELVLTGTANSQTTAVTIPLSATTNTLLRMRILADGVGGTVGPCQINAGGQMEDIAVWIQPAPCQSATATLAGSQTITSGQTATLTATLTGGSPWSLTLSNGQSFSNISSSSFTFTVAPATTTTYMLAQVANACGTGTVSGSAIVTIQNSNTCAAPSSLTESNMTGTTIQLSWQAVVGASTYTGQFREIGTTTWTSFTTSVGAQPGWYMGAYYGKSYEWQIQTNCSNGQSSAFSAIRSFTMTCPQALNRSEAVSPTGANLLWSYMSVQGGSSFTYNLQWRVQGASTWNTIANVCCSAYLISGLTTGQAYEWQIQTICPNGVTTNYTAPRSFTTGCGTPAGFNFNYITSNTAQISWSYQPGISTYDLQWRPTGATSFSMLSGIGGTTYLLTGLTNNTTYEVQVRAVCSTSATSAFSSSTYFRTNCSGPTTVSGSATPNAASISWTYMGPGVRYNLVWRQVGSPTSTTVTSLTTNTYNLTGLLGNTAYQVQIQSVCSDGNLSGLSSPLTFTTQACTAPTGLTQAAYTNAAIVRWNTLSSNIQYVVNWRQAGSSSWNSLTTVSTIVYLGDLAAGTAYEWRLQSVCSAAESSTFSTVSTFTTTSCTTPTALSATTYATQAIMRWQAPGFGLNSDLQWRVQGSTAWNTVSNITEQGSVTTPVVSYWLRNLQPGVTYEWRVQTYCSPGTSSGYTAINSFSITTACGAPANLGILTRTPISCQVRWLETAPQSEVVWRVSGSNASWTSSGPVSSTGGGTVEYTITGLQPGTTYEWQVRGICTDGSSTSYVSGFAFQTPTCALPTISQVAGTNSARLNWSNVGNSYEVQYRAMPEGECFSNTTSTWLSVGTNITAQTQLLSGLTTNTCYQWRVRANCSPESNWVTGYFSTTCGQVLSNLVVTNLTGNSAQLGWTDLGPGNTYEVQWRASGNNALTSSDGCINNTTSSANPWTSLTVTDAATTNLTGLNLSSCYQWRVRLVCGTGNEPFTSVQIFRTPATACTGPLVSVQAGNWDSPSTWSCNRVPTSTDDVVLKHAVTVPAGYTAQVRKLTYDVNSRLIFQTLAKMRLGP